MIEVYKEERPWGAFEQFTHNEESTVKILIVKDLLSYQRHKYRDEFWRVLSGEGFAILNDKKIPLKRGDEVFIKRGDCHRLGSDNKMEVLEISFGHFDEDDNERLEDKYGRNDDKLIKRSVRRT